MSALEQILDGAARPTLTQRIALRVLGVRAQTFGLSGGGLTSGSVSTSGVAVNAQTLLTLSAAWACTRLIAETIATLPLSIYERTSGGKRIARDYWLHPIIHEAPNADATAAVLWESFVAAMLLRGVAHCEKLRVGGRIVGLRMLAPDRLTVSKSTTGADEYRYLEDDGKQVVIPTDRIWKVPGFSLDGKNGVSVIQYGAGVFGAALAADSAASSNFRNGLMPTTGFSIDRVINAAQRAKFRESLREISGAMKAGESPLLEGGMKAFTLAVNPRDAQLLESRAFSVEEVCRWFRVPPHMVGHTEKQTSWGTGVEQMMISFLVFTLRPWLRRIEQAITKDLIGPVDSQRYYARFAVEGLLRADSAARANFYGAMVNNGIMTRDEVRELEDREPMGGNAAVLTVQSAMTTLDAVGRTAEDET